MTDYTSLILKHLIWKLKKKFYEEIWWLTLSKTIKDLVPDIKLYDSKMWQELSFPTHVVC